MQAFCPSPVYAHHLTTLKWPLLSATNCYSELHSGIGIWLWPKHPFLQMLRHECSNSFVALMFSVKQKRSGLKPGSGTAVGYRMVS